MHKSRLFLIAAALTLSLATVTKAAELGVFFGGYNKDTDIQRAQEALDPDIFDRTYTPYFGMSFATDFLTPVLELQHTLGLALDADDSARPHDFLYSGNLHVVIPLDAIHLRPYAGGGLGFVYQFGEQTRFREISDTLGDQFYFQANVGGGVKILLGETVRLRLEVRDYILPNMERARVDDNNDIVSIEKEAVHNLGVTAALTFYY